MSYDVKIYLAMLAIFSCVYSVGDFRRLFQGQTGAIGALHTWLFGGKKEALCASSGCVILTEAPALQSVKTAGCVRECYEWPVGKALAHNGVYVANKA